MYLLPCSYCAISTLLKNPQATVGGQRLRAGHDALGAVNDTSSAWKCHKVGIHCRIESIGVERHGRILVFTLSGKCLMLYGLENKELDSWLIDFTGMRVEEELGIWVRKRDNVVLSP